jgi:succinate dehydrogenase / fumarate reductase cytochrome b subunit
MPTTSKPRPKYLDLFRIRLPLPGVVSILHRLSGAALFLLLPLLLWMLHASLAAPDTYVRFRMFVAHPLSKLVLIGMLWAFLHHLFAGVRFLALDLHYGTELPVARASSWAVLIGSLLLTAILGAWLW